MPRLLPQMPAPCFQDAEQVEAVPEMFVGKGAPASAGAVVCPCAKKRGEAMSASNWVHLEVAKIERETEAAYLLTLEDGEQVWIPKSQISDPDELKAVDEDLTVSVSEWIADQKGLSQ